MLNVEQALNAYDDARDAYDESVDYDVISQLAKLLEAAENAVTVLRQAVIKEVPETVPITMKQVITRQRIKDNTSFAIDMPPGERQRLLFGSAEEDTEREFGGSWKVSKVDILRLIPENGTVRVVAMVTESKTVTV